MIQLFVVDIEKSLRIVNSNQKKTKWMHLLNDGKILIIAGAILSSTSPMAILEPCLPIWLRSNIKPKVIDNYSTCTILI